MAEESSTDYISRVIEPSDRKDSSLEDERGMLRSFYFQKPIGEIQYSESGGATVERDGLTLHLNYRGLDNIIDKPQIEAKERLTAYNKGYRKLTGFSLADNSGNELHLSDLVPDEWSLIFNPESPRYELAGLANIRNKTILINGDLSIPEAILTAIHERGHIEKLSGKDPDELKEAMEKYFACESLTNVPSTEDLAYHLREERDAWAYAANVIRPFTRGSNQIFTPDVVDNHIHERLTIPSDRVRYWSK